ncbi:MAG: VanZ family protein [Bacillales bacterium]|jgi:VanZ family protein|nr:VanZ family protein [Bacillales bacterium]
MNRNVFASILFWIITALLVAVILKFSSQNGTDSNSVSKDVVINIVGENNYNDLVNKYTEDKLLFFVRKMAHFTEYFFFSLSLFMAIYFTNKLVFNLRFIYILLFSLLGVFLLGGIDEIRQSFSVDRTSSFIDVLIDSSGGLLALIFVYLINLLWRKHEKRI